MKITKTDELDIGLEEVRAAQRKFSTYSQEQVDEIFRKAAMAAIDARIPLAKIAVEETGMGLVEDKVIKNHFAGEYIYNEYKDEKTCGVIEKSEPYGITKIAEPIGVIAAIIPTTNPTSTTIFKSLISLKTRNGILFSPHPRAKKSTIAAAKIILDAAVKAGAPEGIIGWIDEPSIELTQMLMQKADITLATGGPSMVKAAYSSGKPAIGVGPGNTPVIIDETAHIKMAVSSIILSKTYDNGVICASEQSVIVLDSIYDKVRKEFEDRGAYIIRKNDMDKVRDTIFVNGSINSKIVGQSAFKIASMAGINVPTTTRVLIGEVNSLGEEEPFAHEKLSPVLAMYNAKDFDDALNKAVVLVNLGGLGHTSSIYADVVTAKDKIDRFSNTMKTVRTFVNIPAAQGASGDLYNFKIAPSFTLGCGSWGGNSVSENVGPKHLLNIKTVAERRENMLWFRVPKKVYFKFGCLQFALRELKDLNKKRAFIVTGKVLYGLGYVDAITKILEEIGVDFKIFNEVEQDPTLATARRGAEEMLKFKPDTIISLGGGSPMDAAKIMWVLYEHPEVKFEDLAMSFMDIRKRIYTFPKLREKAIMISVATSAGTGSEVTPFAVITDEKTGVKYPLADYELTPDMAIVDAELMMNMPKGLTAASGIDALVHGIESYTSVLASEFTNGLALEAIRLIFEYLPQAYSEGATNEKAREKMAHASTMAGMAFANAFLGVCHSMAHKLGAEHNISHGIANGLLIEEVIKFNAVDNPVKQAACPQYKYPNAIWRYARIADYLKLGGNTDKEKVELLIKAIHELKEKLNIPLTIKDAGVSEKNFYATLDKVSELALDDQCTGANPRFPLTSEIKQMFINAFN
ncbi:bifunctional acetaldehyde-CoA/alcohol dehydrogenase [Clostridium sp.]|jgi:acetaldehyde dehydrogenase/alcohol dehydrogenase|uniref:bifunctional acetaldehyde-CoA/alcohol dehydrogenase n=1 Tax=Clostridium sp. TaxID=1506 RepID=UPI0025856A39|nr:bifunctional acetaldehyde-CoA/alcohol dehydrogenase [Clostridium sp.]MDF2505188.1 alcohol dehydrogenase, class [Clostridium sp.]MDF2866527.1 alcohol dehydrogenase, class [Clostridia bacterium]